jgi:hypothetical protein
MKKAVFILMNWGASWLGLGFTDERGAIAGALWFILSSLLMVVAVGKGWLKAFESSRLGRMLLEEN